MPQRAPRADNGAAARGSRQRPGRPRPSGGELEDWQPPEVFDTLRLARRLVPGLPGYRLGMLVEQFRLAGGLPDGLKPHRAMYDALVTARLFIYLATGAGSLEALRGMPPEKAGEDALF